MICGSYCKDKAKCLYCTLLAVLLFRGLLFLGSVGLCHLNGFCMLWLDDGLRDKRQS